MKKYLFSLLLVMSAFSIYAQVGINQDNATPDPSAMLDVKSTDKGMLIPRMTTVQREAIANPATGLLVFDNTTNSFWAWIAGQWFELDGNAADDFSGSFNDLTDVPVTTINTDNQTLNLSGTTLSIANGNSVDLGTLPSDNNWSLSGNDIYNTNNGFVGIGTALPKQKLHVNGDYYGRGHLWLYSSGGDGTSGTAYVQARDDSGTSNIGLGFRTQNSGAIAEALSLSKEGNVGIGEIAPNRQVIIRKDANDLSSNQLVLKNRAQIATGTGSRIVFQGYRDTNDDYEVASIEVQHKEGDLVNAVHGGSLVFKTNDGDSPYPQQGAERMAISEDGIISTAGPLNVNGGMNMNSNIKMDGHYLSGDGSNNGILVYYDSRVGIGDIFGNAYFSVKGSDGWPFSFIVDGNDDGTIDLGVRNDGALSAQLGGNSSVFPLNVVQDNQGYLRYAVSSRRYKKNIQAARLSQDVDRFLNLELKAFQFRGDSSGLYDYGFIAEEVDALGLSRPLVWKKDGQVESLYFDHIAFFNFAALQQHRDRIQVLEEKLLETEGKIARLEAENALMQADIQAIKAVLPLPDKGVGKD